MDFDYVAPSGAVRQYQATIGFFDLSFSRVGEFFMSSGKSGTDIDVATRDAAVALSIALQHGARLEDVAKSFMHNANGEPEGPLGVVCRLFLDEIAREIEEGRA